MKKLTLEDISIRSLIDISEEDMKKASLETLNFSEEELSKDKLTSDEIIGLILSVALDEVNKNFLVKNELFLMRTNLQSRIWNIICDKDVIIIDEYIYDEYQEELDFFASCETTISECRTKLEVSWEYSDEYIDFLKEYKYNESVHQINTVCTILTSVDILKDIHI